MKGQFTIEYIVSFLIFIGIVSYIHLSTSKFLPDYLKGAKNDLIMSDAYLLSEVIVNDLGEPPNWDSLGKNEIKRIGLSGENYNKTNLLSLGKIKRLNEICNTDYEFVKQRLGMERDFVIMIFDLDDVRDINVVCSGKSVKHVNVTVRRIVAYTDGNDFGLAEVIVQTW